MKCNHRKKIGLIIVAFIWSLSTLAQISPEKLKQFLTDRKNTINRSAVLTFYSRLNFATAWIERSPNTNIVVLYNAIMQSSGMGLKPQDYSLNFIEAYRNKTLRLLNINDSLEAEIRISEVAIHFYNDIAYGNIIPSLGYSGLNYHPDCYNIPQLLAEYISGRRLSLLMVNISPSLPEISAIENKIRWFNAVMASSNFQELKITLKKENESNFPLLLKLYTLGTIDSIKQSIPQNELKQKIKEVQLQFDLPADGILHANLVQALNVPLSVRLQQLNLAINYYRWLKCLNQDQSTVVVNIPAAILKVYRKDKVILQMRMIVGKKSTHTPTLASTISEVILYPYWHVPNKIATKELLPAIKRNRGFIDAGGYQILNKAGKIMNPYSINWHALSRSNFPYIIRQSTGCDNALGLIKLDFYNPFTVYLHDTPNKNLFQKSKRFFSHGCMRMEKPMDLGHLVLKNNAIAIDTLTQKGCLRNQSPITVHADVHMPVIVWYNPVGIDSTGRVIYYEDVYGKFDWMRRK